MGIDLVWCISRKVVSTNNTLGLEFESILEDWATLEPLSTEATESREAQVRALSIPAVWEIEEALALRYRPGARYHIYRVFESIYMGPATMCIRAGL